MTITTTNALDGLLYIRNGNFSARWNFPDAVGSQLSSPAGIGNPVEVTYSFLTAAPSYSSISGFQALDALQKTATRAVLASIEEVTNISFVEMVGASQMTFGNSAQSLSQGGYAYTPSYAYGYSGSTITSVTEQNKAGDVWINGNATWEANAWQPGHGGYVTLLHEIGHALGLKHPFEAGTNGYLLASSLDNEHNTVMSYTKAPNSGLIEVSGSSSSYSWQQFSLRPSTLMSLDIEALQYLYGTHTSTRIGNDVYRWETSPEILATLWDSAGNDTIDCSNQVLTCVIDLQAGASSSISLRQTDAEIRVGLGLPSWFNQPLPTNVYNGRDNIVIAKGVIIENATGGSGDDLIYGNEVSNRLSGGAGSDSLMGAAGNDVLNGGTGSDSMSGGTGNDTFYVDNSGDAVSEAGGAGTDTVYTYLSGYILGANVENGRILHTGTASLTGNELANVLYAGTGNNVLNGRLGTDTVSYQYATTAVKVSLALTTAQITGGSGTDTLTSIENLVGGSANDSLTGSTLANSLTGGAGNDALSAGAGNDLLVGGLGADKLTGGTGADRFDFNILTELGLTSTTRDTIVDFKTSEGDKIDLLGVDANTALASDQAFSYLGTAAFSGNATAKLRFDTVNHILYGSTDADTAAEFAILLTGVSSLASTDLVL